MAKINKYQKIIEKGKIGILKKILNLKTLEISEIPETDRIRIYLKFIIENIDKNGLKVSSLIKEFCLLEKALGKEYSGKFIIKNRSKNRYVPMARYDHYKIIIFNGLKKLGIELEENKVLQRKHLEDLSKIIWH
ncbi:MAG: hypothetical protein CMH62_01335 [Nanoarchaeota archaeon]|nr:hypothetical protein [Nanoarchaeota archaeon]|tara:strand:- start:1075 stop:1476 length:402 start_codon:yes stop_codon:yes gene_type:complete